MKKYFYIALLNTILNLFQHFNINAQVNLVPNPSFENIDTCNFYNGGVSDGYVPPWDMHCGCSPDLFNTCTPNSICQVPSSSFGYQYPHTGNGYVGQCFYISSGLREYIQVKLDTDLIANKTYCASFYVSLSNYANIATNNFGMYFSPSHTYTSSNMYLNFSPQINYTSVITDTLDWTLISGSFMASGGERYLIIGNFYSNANTDTSWVSHQIGGNIGYYLIDDVSVFEMQNADAGRDTTICHGDSVQLGSPDCMGIIYNWQPTNGLSNPNISNPWAKPLLASTVYYLTETTPCGILLDTVVVSLGNCFAGVGELHKKSNYKLYPNPNTGSMTLEYTMEGTSTAVFNIYDMAGRLVKGLTIDANNKTVNIDATELNGGVYYYTVNEEGKKVKTEKLVIVK